MPRQYKTTAIVLHSIPHGDRGFIVYLYTRALGRVNFYIYGSKRNVATVGGTKISLLPLSLLDIVGEIPQRGDLHRLKEAKSLHLSANLSGDILKSTITMYISEFLYRVVKDKVSEPLLFDYLVGSIKTLGHLTQSQSANFHLYFTINIGRFLGFYPSNDYFDDSFFDMHISKFVTMPPNHGNYFDQPLSRLMASFLTISIEELSNIDAGRNSRKSLLEGVIYYFGLHHETKYNIESIEILSQIF